MRRLLVLLSILVTAFVVGGVKAPVAHAAVTCATHQVFIDSWSEQQDWITWSSNFRCGGSTSDYRLHIVLQELGFDGKYFTPSCVNVGLCDNQWRPSSSTWFGAGDLNQNSGTYNVASDISGERFRVRVIVKFRNGDPDEHYNSQSAVL